MAEDVRVVIGGDSQALNQALAQSQQILARARAGIQQELDKIERGFRDKTGAAAGAVGGLGSTLTRLTPLLAGLGVSLSAAGLIAFGRNVVETVGALGEQAEQLGVGTQSLQVYQFAASQTNVKQGELEKGLARLTRTIGEAAEGSDAALKRFNGLGVGILDAGGKVRSTDDVLQDVARAIAAIEDPAKRAAAAADLFGRGGQRMLPLLAEVAAGMDGVTAQAKAAGAVLDDALIKRFDELSDGMARNAKQAVGWAATILDQMTHVSDFDRSRMEELGLLRRPPFPARTKVSVDLPPPIRKAALDVAGGEPGGVGPAVSRNPQSEADRRRNAALDKYLGGLEQQARLEGLVGAEREQAKAILEAEVKLLDDQGNITRPLTEAERARALAAADALRDAKLESQVKKDDLARATELAAQRDKDRQDAFARSSAIIESNAIRERQAEKHLAALEQEAELERLIGVEREVARATIEAQNQLLDAQGFKIRDLSDSERQRLETAVRLRERVAEANRQSQAALGELESFSSRAFDRIGAGITQIFLEGKRGALDFRNVFSAIVSELAQEFIRLSMINPLRNLINPRANLPTLGDVSGGPLGSLFSRLFGGGNLMGSFEMAAGGIMTAHGPVPLRRYEGGGIARSPQAAIFGEGSTPEAYVPVPFGRIPVELRGADGASVNLYQDIRIDARGAEPSVLPRLNAILARHKEDTVTAVYALMRKGGRESRIAGLRH